MSRSDQSQTQADSAGDRDALITEAGSSAANGHVFVSFRLAEKTYALPLTEVERALRMPALLAVPEAPTWILGVLNLKGDAVPVIDLRRRFGLNTKDVQVQDRLLVVRRQAHRLALWIDDVLDVTSVAAESVHPPPGTLNRSKALKAVIRHDDQLIPVLEFTAIEPDSQTDADSALPDFEAVLKSAIAPRESETPHPPASSATHPHD